MQNSQSKHIFECSKKGKTQQLLEALTHIDDKNIVDDRQNSILAISLKHGQWQTTKALIEKNFTFFHAKKPGLIAACQFKKDDPKGIQILLKEGHDINDQDHQKRTSLMTVSLLGHLKKAQELLINNADINLSDKHGNTALMDAVVSRNKNLVQLLIDGNAKIDQVNDCGETALIIMLKQKSPVEDIVKMLMKAGANPELIDHNKKSSWLIAKQKHPKIARIIEIHLNEVNQIELPFFTNTYQVDNASQTIDINIDIKTEDKQEKTKIEPTVNNTQQTSEPLNIEPSIDLKSPESLDGHNSHLVKKPIDAQNENKKEPTIQDNLLENSTNTIDANSQPNTKPIHSNISKPEVANPYLFSKKPKKSNQQEWFHAAKTGNLGSLNRMIIEGIDIDCVDAKGCTALIRASGHSRRAVVSFLLQQNANIEARSLNGSTALSSSIIGNCKHVAGLLLENGANVNALGPSNYSYVTIAAAQWNDAMLSILYRNGGDIFVLNKLNQTLLHIIALAAEFYNNINNAKTSIQYLLDHGMDINSQDQNGDTALLILCGSHKKKYQVDDRNIASIVHFLIKMGAAAAITNKLGHSALDMCRLHKLQQTKGVLMNALSWNDQ
ncbi:MAG: ankyrin repeat domain-containing protein [Marinicellaceae bacterium]